MARGRGRIVTAPTTKWVRDTIAAGPTPSDIQKVLNVVGNTQRLYVRPGTGGSIVGAVGQLFNNAHGGAFQLYSDIDNFYSFRGARVGAALFEEFGISRLAQNITGIGGNVSTVNSYATVLGGSFTGTFEGPGFAFLHYADDRGGIWRFNVDNGSRIVDISTWEIAPITTKKQIVVSDMSEGTHTFLATFQGADPLHAPSSGGNGRGWFKNLTEGCIQDADISVPASGVYALAGTSIAENAISCRPTNKAVAAEWAPSHGPSGVTQNIIRKFYVNGNEIGAIPSLRNIQTFAIEQSYSSYNPNDTVSPIKMWDGLVNHEFSYKGLRVRDKKLFTADVTITEAYLGTVAGNINVTDRIRFGAGQDFPITNTTASTDVAGTPVSALFYNAATNIIGRGTITDISKVLTLGQLGPGVSGIFYTERTDDTSKAYWRKIAGGVVIPAGTVWETDTCYIASSGVVPSSVF